MNGRTRIATVMRHKKPDRIPVMCQLATGHLYLNTSHKPHEVWFNSESWVRAAVEMQQRYQFDGILVNLPGRPDDILDGLVELEETKDGERLTFDTGETVLVPWDDNAIYDPGTSGRKERFDFNTDEPDDLDNVDDLARYVWGVYHIPWLPGKNHKGPLDTVPEYFYKTIDLARDLTNGEVSIHGECFSPFTHYMELVGYELALINLLMDPAKAHALLERLTVASVAWAVGQAERGADAVLISSAFAGGPMISTDMYKEFVIPYESQVTAAVKAEGVPVYTHTCGSIGDRLKLMVDTGTNGIDTLDPPPLGTVELKIAKEEVGSDVFIKGNMDPVYLLTAKTEAEIIEHAQDRIHTGKPGSGYILSTACSVSPLVEPWKLELLTPTAEHLGQYDASSV